MAARMAVHRDRIRATVDRTSRQRGPTRRQAGAIRHRGRATRRRDPTRRQHGQIRRLATALPRHMVPVVADRMVAEARMAAGTTES
jgi:hypothetical protein